MSAWSWFFPRAAKTAIALSVSVLPFTGFLNAEAPSPAFSVTSLTQTPAYNAVTADMNGDGLPDLVYLQGNGPEGAPTYPSVAVLLNNGSGYSTTPIVTTPLNCFAGAPITADVNGDHKQDAILSCTGFLVVMLGNGDGTFQSPTYFAAPGLSTLLAVDLNGDGYPDIVGVDINTSTPPQPTQFSILLNKGASAPGSFGAATSQTGGGGAPLLAGDFNGDGKQDVLMSSNASESPGELSIEVYFGNGDGTLQSPVSVGSGYINGYTIGDWNGDGVTDIAYTMTTDSLDSNPTLVTVMGAASGTFTTGASYPLPAGGIYTQLLALKHPLVTGYSSELALIGGFTTLFFGNASGQFVQGPSYALSGNAIEQLNSDNSTQLQFFSNNYMLSAPVVNGGLQALAAEPIDHNGAFNPYGLGASTDYALSDLNGDGLPDLVSISSAGQLTTSLSRGNGTFSMVSQVSSQANGLLTGDFNGDGIQDVLAYIGGYSPMGSFDHGQQLLPQTMYYQGNGIGTLPATPVTSTLPLTQISYAISGDFNGDGYADLIVVALGTADSGQSAGIFFLAGKGNGTFAAPALVDESPTQTAAILLVADLNHDGKPDFVFGNASFLSNGDGTFQAVPLGLATGVTVVALADLNGDGNADAVTNQGAILAGNGDGTFQTASLASISIPQGVYLYALSIGDVNGDGHPDVVAQLASPGVSWLSILDGDGTGNFTADPQMYYAGNAPTPIYGLPIQGILTRLNNSAPVLASDSVLDYLSVPSNFIVAPLFNAHNPVSTTPTLLLSATALTASAISVTTGTQITLTANVSGYQVSGNVTFNNGSNALGTASLTNGVATLPVSFSAAGTYSITASYGGDSNNIASTSNTVTVTVAAPVAPDFTVTAAPASATVTRGQSATTTLTITPNSTYSGTVALSCGTLPSGVACSFSPATVSTANGAASSKLTITTTAPSTAALAEPQRDLEKVVWAGLFCLIFLPFGKTSRRWKAARSSLLSLCLMAVLFAVSACGGSSSSSSTPTNPGTPTGAQTITVQVSDSSANLSQTVPFTLTVQ